MAHEEETGAGRSRGSGETFRALFANANAAPVAAICLMTLGQLRVLERLLFVDPAEVGFVLASVRGVIDGTPVSKSWQHRILAPYVFRALEQICPDSLTTLEVFLRIFVLGANVSLFVLSRKRGVRPWSAFFICGGFALARCFLTYKLEYPWDGIDVVLFLVFGYAAASEWRLFRMLPLLSVGVLNHETVLYIPAWFLLSPIARRPAAAARRDFLEGIVVSGLLGAVIVTLRSGFYVRRPVMEHQVFEVPAPVIENHVHVMHNVRQLFFYDWVEGRAFVALAFCAAVAASGICIARGRAVRASWWTLGVLSTVIAFGYVNETRHYLPLLAFWVAYAGPAVTRSQEARA
jgi:hypothetical protein